MGSLASIGIIFDKVSDLKLQAGTANISVYVNYGTTPSDGNGGNYVWDSSSTLTADDFKIVQVTGLTTGRWLRCPNSDAGKGSAILSGTALQYSYVVNHSLPYTPVKIFIEPTSAPAAIAHWVDKSLITSTSFTIIFLSIPTLGMNNITFDWIAYKQ